MIIKRNIFLEIWGLEYIINPTYKINIRLPNIQIKYED